MEQLHQLCLVWSGFLIPFIIHTASSGLVQTSSSQHNSTSSFHQESSQQYERRFATSENITKITGTSFAEATESNQTWKAASHQELIYTTDDKLITVSEDQLPTEYWVPVKPKLKYWPNKTIAAQVGQEFTSQERDMIWDALEELSKTIDHCLRFVIRTPYESDYLHFKKAATCDSRIGYKGGKHIVKLSTGCLDPDEPGAIQHEVLHALGFFHEHSRKDRDDWVEINWNNVDPQDQRDFKKLKFHTFDLPYDYISVMHYASDAYAIDETVPTLEPKKPNVNITMMGQRVGLSPTDVRRVRIPYQCDADQASLVRNSGQNRNIYQRSDNNEAEVDEEFSRLD